MNNDNDSAKMQQLINSGLSVDELLIAKDRINRDNLTNLAIDNVTQTDVANILDGDSMTKLKVFMISQAKSELTRVIKLTDTLNKLEDTYMTRALDDAEGMDMQSLAITMDVITKSLTRSMDLISKVTEDSGLQILIDQSTNILNNTDNSNSPTVNVIDNQESREKMRNIATQLLQTLKSSEPTNNPSDNAIDVDAQDANGDAHE